jgi:L-ascorbate metabolism protein UlaG (beta-lactamase superfamily)
MKRLLLWPVTGWRLKVGGAAVVVLAALAVVGYGSTSWGAAFGASPEEVRARSQRSPRFEADRFPNPIPTTTRMQGKDAWKEMSTRSLFNEAEESPPEPLPVGAPAFGQRFALTWLGHSSVLVEMDGAALLFDPLFSERCSPSTLVGPARFHPVPVAVAELPELDAVIISHDHYDHLDHQTVLALAPRVSRWIVPLGVGAHLRAWSIPEAHITELDWWQAARVSDVSVVATPARHFSGRLRASENRTLWASFAVVGPERRVYFGGDTGFFPGFADIGRRFGPFDVTLMPIGAYSEFWEAIHLNPEQALDAHELLRGGALLPIHAGTFDLALHAWDEPVKRLRAAAKDVELLLPRPGETVVRTPSASAASTTGAGSASPPPGSTGPAPAGDRAAPRRGTPDPADRR